ncbi:MAG: cytochrome c oxidase subunit 3 [Rhodospirillales bacterium]|nr:cytochrome c oxidase subunit 3 [Rhodospirillales bacterium]
MSQHAHPYHLVSPSPWPVVGAFGALTLAVGGIMYMHELAYGSAVLAIGSLLVAFTMVVWWRDVVREAEHEGHHTPVVQLGLRYGMVLFIASEVMFFVAWFWAFFDASLFADEAQQVARVTFTGGTWPPTGVEVFAPFHLPLLNTIILLTSGATVTWAHHALREGKRSGLIQGLCVTVALGVAFTAVQAFEYAHAPFAFTDGIYSSTFFMATGFHGAHVLIGSIFLIVCLARSIAGHFKPEQHFGFEAAAWYWHFVDVVWLFLFFAIYWWGGSGGVIH